MAKAERILAIDLGATSIKVGEFEYPGKDGIRLVNFAQREYEEELTDSSRAVVVAGLLRQMLMENRFTARKTLVSISGQSAFSRFVRLPPFSEDQSRIRQVVEFQARQNVPFPMEEVVWDYQLVATPDSDDIDVMFVVIKNDIVEQMTGAIQAVGLDPVLVDVASAACYNGARANNVGQEECSIVLNIGGRSTSLIIADGERVFTRTIPIAGHTITQQIGKEFGIGFAEAEELKRRHGFVALGGAYAEPESETAAAVSKIIRNVMARLHGEVNRSITVYRSQHKGNKPTRMYLTGGSSTMTYTDRFFTEKLRVEVEYLNPFGVVQIGPAIDRQGLEEVAHMFSEVIGLGLRYRFPCSIEVSLIPDSIRRQQALKRKKPYLMASCICFVILMLVVWQGMVVCANQTAKSLEELTKKRNQNELVLRAIKSATSETDSLNGRYQEVCDFLGERQRWPAIYNELYRLKPDNLWLVSVRPIIGEMKAVAGEDEGGDAMGGMGGMGMGGGEMGMGGGDMGMGGGDMGMGGGMGGMGMGDGDSGATVTEVEITGLEIIGHSVILSDIKGYVARRVNMPKMAIEPVVDEEDGNEIDVEGEEKKKVEELPAGTPGLEYLALLRKSPMFDEDESYTAIKNYYSPTVIKNLSSFVIQVKFKEALPFTEISGSKAGGGGMMGGAEGGGMMGPEGM